MGLHGVYMPIKITWDFNKPKDNMIFQLVFDFFHVFPMDHNLSMEKP